MNHAGVTKRTKGRKVFESLRVFGLGHRMIKNQETICEWVNGRWVEKSSHVSWEMRTAIEELPPAEISRRGIRVKATEQLGRKGGAA